MQTDVCGFTILLPLMEGKTGHDVFDRSWRLHCFSCSVFKDSIDRMMTVYFGKLIINNESRMTPVYYGKQ